MKYYYIVHTTDPEEKEFQGIMVASDYLEAIKRIVIFYKYDIAFAEIIITDDETAPYFGAKITFSHQAICDILGEDNND